MTLIRKKSKNNMKSAARQAKYWIKRNTIANNGIVITSKQRRIYQEVTGYYIPTLLQFKMVDEAIHYAKWLCKVQQPSGAWMSYDLKHESVFNTGQVLRGLVAICDILPEVKENMIRGADWLISNIQDSGRLKPTEGTSFTNGTNSELIHVYCLPPLIKIGKLTGNKAYEKQVRKCLEYYKEFYKEDIENFNYLSHFYAYVIEAMVDLGEYEIAEQAMKKIERIQNRDGSVPAYKNVHWVCSTGLFQFAIIWFKLGDYVHGKKAFDYGIELQNKSGGWFGGYPNFSYYIWSKVKKEKISYFPDEEISWAVKYFFDALYYKTQCKNKRQGAAGNVGRF